MSKYRKVHVKMWRDGFFSSLSTEARLVWVYLLTSPQTRSTGIYCLSPEQAARDLGMEPEGFGKAFREAFTKGSPGALMWDEKNGIILLPHFLKFNPPENPNVVTSWRGLIDEIPEASPLLIEWFSVAKGFQEGFSKGFQEAFLKAFGKGYAKGLITPNPSPNPNPIQGEQAQVPPPLSLFPDEPKPKPKRTPRTKPTEDPFHRGIVETYGLVWTERTDSPPPPLNRSTWGAVKRTALWLRKAQPEADDESLLEGLRIGLLNRRTLPKLDFLDRDIAHVMTAEIKP